MPTQPTARRTLVLWLGSFLMAALLLVGYWGVPLVPVAVAGVVTLVVTLIRMGRSRNRPAS